MRKSVMSLVSNQCDIFISQRPVHLLGGSHERGCLTAELWINGVLLCIYCLLMEILCDKCIMGACKR